MANFDSNRWYQILVEGASDILSMDGTPLYDHGKGAVFFQNTNTSLPGQQWQIYTFNSSTYVLRTKESGPDGYMNVVVSVNETTPGGTVPTMYNYTISDSSMFWQISPWGDGTFFFTNAANGTAWHLDVKPNALMAMSSNITAPQPDQAFSFKTLGAIDDNRFSTTPPATSIPTATATNSNLPTSTAPSSSTTASSPSSGSQGLSSGASAAIGASIGGVALIALLIIGYILLRRRKRRSAAFENVQELPSQGPYLSDSQKPPLSGMSELQVPPAELSGKGLAAEPAELPGNPRSETILDGRRT